MSERIQTSSRAGALTALALAACAACTTIIRPFEGTVTHTYPDVVYGWKLPTACRGHTGTFNGAPLVAGQDFTLAECDEMESADLRKTFDAEAACMDVAKLNANQLGAFLSLGFNIGAGKVCSSSIPRKVKAGQIAAACATIAEFDKANGKDCHLAASNCYGIIRRRSAESALCAQP